MASGPPKKLEEVIEELGDELRTLNKAIEATMKNQSAAEKDSKKAQNLKKDLDTLVKRAEDQLNAIKALQAQLAKNMKS